MWVEVANRRAHIVLELGAGFATPRVVRWPLEEIVYAVPQAHFVRVNLADATIPPEIRARSLSLPGDAVTAVDAIWQACSGAASRGAGQVAHHHV
jgi:hypothetical protein